MNKLFSILVSRIQNEEKLVECLKSIVEQRFFNYEIILVSDEPEKYSTILEEFSHRSDMKIVFMENSNINSARNLAISASKGRYLFFVQEDEFYDNHYLHECCKKVLISKNKLIITKNIEKNIEDNWNEIRGKVYDGDLIRREKMKFNDNLDSQLEFNKMYMNAGKGIVYCEKAIYKMN